MLKIQGLHKKYGNYHALDGLDMELKDGALFGFVGPNGAGKTTTIKSMTGLLKPDRGTVELDGKDMLADTMGLRMRIGYVPDHFGLYDNLKVSEYMEFFAACYHLEGFEARKRARSLLEQVGLGERMDAFVDGLSRGMQQRLCLARALIHDPELLIMDEPDVFLDFENIIGLSKLINNYEGTIIAISHNRLLLSQCFNKILHLENMELQEFPGTFAEYNQAMLETKVQMAEQATKDAEWIAVQEKLIEKIRAEATYIDNPAKGRQLKARVSYLERLQARQCKNPFIENHGYDFTFPEVERPEDFDPENAPVVISVKDYALSFDRELLKNVSFDIKAGEKVAIVGANGTGKSSMLKDIYESMKSDVDRIGYYTQIFDDDPEQLSGGERNIKQLRALCESDAEILFLDEPSSHLDTYAQIALEKAIKEYKGTVLMVTHDFYTVANCADRILLLENGTVREQSGRAYRKSIYKKYFESDIFEAERIRVEREVKINALLRDGKWKEAKNVL